MCITDQLNDVAENDVGDESGPGCKLLGQIEQLQGSRGWCMLQGSKKMQLLPNSILEVKQDT